MMTLVRLGSIGGSPATNVVSDYGGSTIVYVSDFASPYQLSVLAHPLGVAAQDREFNKAEGVAGVRIERL